MLTTISKFAISVYEGISPSLLATMSLSAGIGGKTNEEMVESLVKAQIIQTEALSEAMKAVDRGWFVKAAQPYRNQPYTISGNQKMTDIFTHAVILQQIHQYLKDGCSVLDIGTGHGYLPFVLGQLQTQMKIVGLDINANAIEMCNQIRGKVKCYSDVSFQQQDLNQFLDKDSRAWDVIIGGFYISTSLEERLVRSLNPQNGVGVWPRTHEDGGQALYKFSKKDEIVSNQFIISTLFSEPILRTSVSKYFLDDDQPVQNDESPQNHEELLLKVRKQKQQKKDKLKEKLKEAVIKHSKLQKKKLSLTQMKSIEQIDSILRQLNPKK